MQYIEDVLEAPTLNNIKCQQCKNYLSVEPIFTDVETSSNICGRCNSNSMLLDHNLFYEILARQFIFPCAYMQYGCGVRSLLDSLATHEKTCPYLQFTCFCLWFGNLFDFIKHFEEAHTNYIIQTSDIFSIKEYPYFLLQYEGLYFFITCFYQNGEPLIQIQGLTNASRESNATFNCKEIDANIKTKITLNTIHKLNCSKESLHTFTLSVNVADDFIIDVFNMIVCPNCFMQMTPPILRCSVGHITCLECLEAWFDYCQACGTEEIFTCDSELQSLALGAKYLCKWNCGNFFNSNYIREHEQGCARRIFHCWHSMECNWKGSFRDLIVHESACLAFLSRSYDSCVFHVNTSEVLFPGTISRRKVYHLVVNNCCISVILDYQVTGAVVYINHFDVYGFGWFRFEAALEHIEDRHCTFNRVYNIPVGLGGIYKVEIPGSDIIKFNEPRFYNIKVRVIRLNKQYENMYTDNLYQHFKNYSKLHHV